jgi:hypothetical protein
LRVGPGASLLQLNRDGLRVLEKRADFLVLVKPGRAFGVGIAPVEGPTLIAAIVLARKVTRIWVRSALRATGPFLGFFAYVVGYGVLRHPPFAFPF